MFRMYGRIVQVLRYQVDYTRDEREETVYAATEQEAQDAAQMLGGTVTALPPDNDEWMDGLEVADVPDTYGEAVCIREMGQAAYEAAKNKPDAETRLAALESAMLSMMMGGTINV